MLPCLRRKRSELIATTIAAKKRKRKKIKLKKKRLVVLPPKTLASGRRKRVGGGFSVVQIRGKNDVRIGKKKKLKVKLKRRKKLRWKRGVVPRANDPTSLHVGRDVESKSNLPSGLLTKATITKKKKMKLKPKTKKVALRRISVLRGSKKPMSSVK